jgi:hypothetical protein
VLVEPRARLVHGLAVLDAVDGRGFHHAARSQLRRKSPAKMPPF